GGRVRDAVRALRVRHSVRIAGWPRVTPLTMFGLFAVTAMLVCYALESRSHWFTLAFAAACILGSIYGFLQGAWPFALVEGIWSAVAVRRWWLASRVASSR